MTDSGKAGRAPHTIVAVVKDRPGVLYRVAACLQAKGFNIRSLAVGASETDQLSRMTFVVDASTDAEEVVSELRKLDDIAEIEDISDREFVSRELALIRVRGEKEVRKRLMDIVDIFNAKIIDVSGVEIQESDTEGDCLRRVQDAGAAAHPRYFNGLTGTWMQLAYAGRTPPETEVRALCESWPFRERGIA